MLFAKTDIVFRIRMSKLSQISRLGFQATRRELVDQYILFCCLLQWSYLQPYCDVDMVKLTN